MNQITLAPAAPFAPDHAHAVASTDALEARFALRMTARLTERSRDLDSDIIERLRFARKKALGAAKSVRIAESSVVMGPGHSGAAVIGKLGSGWWLKLGSIAPMFALIAGLVFIERWQSSSQISVAAEVDAALLSDALPPNAYSDVGFAEFLKTPIE